MAPKTFQKHWDLMVMNDERDFHQHAWGILIGMYPLVIEQCPKSLYFIGKPSYTRAIFQSYVKLPGGIFMGFIVFFQIGLLETFERCSSALESFRVSGKTVGFNHFVGCQCWGSTRAYGAGQEVTQRCSTSPSELFYRWVYHPASNMASWQIQSF